MAVPGDTGVAACPIEGYAVVEVDIFSSEGVFVPLLV